MHSLDVIYVIQQSGLIVLTLAGAALVSSDSKHRHWGFVLGLLAQPFWLWVAWDTRQISLFILTIVYTAIWVNGIRNNFNRKKICK